MTNPVWKYIQGLNSFGGYFGIALGALVGGITPASSAFPAANDAIFVPAYVNQVITVKRLFSVNGATLAGSIDVGIYTQGGDKIVSAGSNLQSGTNVPQFFDIADLSLSPGRYYLAVAMSNVTGTLFRAAAGVSTLRELGVAKQASGFALPGTVTFATVTAAYLPLIGAEISDIR